MHNNKVDVVKWPANSPDLNIVENFHNLWKDRVDKRNPTTKEQLKKIIKEEFKKFTTAEIKNLVEKFPNRLSKILKEQGGHIPY